MKFLEFSGMRWMLMSVELQVPIDCVWFSWWLAISVRQQQYSSTPESENLKIVLAIGYNIMGM